MSLTDHEEWKPVVGWEELYEISTLGRVWAKPRISEFEQGGRVVRRTLPGGMRKSSERLGYKYVMLYREGRGSARQIHRLIAEAFLPNPNNLPFVLHWDDNPKNNHISNLRWGTPSENLRDAVRNGTHWGTKKTHCPYGHRLIEPNLVPSRIKAGHRICLSCKRARSNAARDNKPFTKERADMFYRKIMTTKDEEEK